MNNQDMLVNAKLQVDIENTLPIKWLNPREGGEVMEGSVTSLEGKGIQSLGDPPSDPEEDWVVIIG